MKTLKQYLNNCDMEVLSLTPAAGKLRQKNNLHEDNLIHLPTKNKSKQNKAQTRKESNHTRSIGPHWGFWPAWHCPKSRHTELIVQQDLSLPHLQMRRLSWAAINGQRLEQGAMEPGSNRQAGFRACVSRPHISSQRLTAG